VAQASAGLQRLAGAVFLAVPVAFGAIRAITTGADRRYLWLAAAAIGGSTVVAWAGRAAGRPARLPILLVLAATAAGTVCAFAAGILLGARAGPGIAIVAVSFGLCTGIGAALAIGARSRFRRTGV
jgi:hypothetical protein